MPAQVWLAVQCLFCEMSPTQTSGMYFIVYILCLREIATGSKQLRKATGGLYFPDFSAVLPPTLHPMPTCWLGKPSAPTLTLTQEMAGT